MSKIVSIGTAVPAYAHRQQEILSFMQRIYAMNEAGNRKLQFLYHQSGIDIRYSVISDYTRPAREWQFYPATENLEPFPSLEARMQWYGKYAAPLSLEAIRKCLDGRLDPQEVTHLITVSCTGMSAPGLDLEIVASLGLPNTVFRTSVNFMGCYAAIHALKLADALCNSGAAAKILVVCTELCTLHFQREPTMNNLLSSLLFSDGSAAVLVTKDDDPAQGIHIDGFYSEIMPQGKKDMSWQLSSTGFQMGLSSYVPELIEEDFAGLVSHALEKHHIPRKSVSHWCIHPGGKKILEAIYKSMHFTNGHLDTSFQVLKEYGNMSSATILFVLERMLSSFDYGTPNVVFGAAFGPGLTMESFIASTR
ncbi:type III polyketide synthase [Flavitalea sp. BT771]|uniref:type III polyketide synthase n=1 Tax=Flavitalea sp. BT771 TaxID=3063329 RepID=UPI0026E2565A|nr:type III polyketide synthase [Flavitalea sp. BT771]MDO6435517.1 type III polyketide synthase [Flavitalea sp. BT771]MDV6224417.1 type III polyketide synthase [Flavitalea sp. BT771]